ncbi:MAG: hypothetical protein H8E37_01120, partial [Planctomycetes bacterium]|nr:hypothetical protein [Planctomycetota bacterium]
MRLSSTVSAFIFCCTLTSAMLVARPAAAIEFPFDAIVNSDEVLIWSGTSGKTEDYVTM